MESLYCKDCTFYERSVTYRQFGVNAPSIAFDLCSYRYDLDREDSGSSMVHGDKHPVHFTRCYDMRDETGLCGPEARLYSRTRRTTAMILRRFVAKFFDTDAYYMNL